MRGSAVLRRQFLEGDAAAEWAMLVYDDLEQVKRWSALELIDLAPNGSWLIVGVPFGQATAKAVVPRPSAHAVSPRNIDAIFEAIANRLPDHRSFIFAFVSCDSTITYFIMHRGLIAADPVQKSLHQ